LTKQINHVVLKKEEVMALTEKTQKEIDEIWSGRHRVLAYDEKLAKAVCELLLIRKEVPTGYMRLQNFLEELGDTDAVNFLSVYAPLYTRQKIRESSDHSLGTWLGNNQP